MKRMNMIMILSLFLGLVAVVGCSGSGDTSATDELEKAAATVEEAGDDLMETAGSAVEDLTDMSSEEIQSKIDELKTMIADKEGRVQEITAKLKDMSPSDLMGDEAKNLKAESETIMGEIAGLKKKVETFMAGNGE